MVGRLRWKLFSTDAAGRLFWRLMQVTLSERTLERENNIDHLSKEGVLILGPPLPVATCAVQGGGPTIRSMVRLEGTLDD